MWIYVVLNSVCMVAVEFECIELSMLIEVLSSKF
jgi:hypothetical protein